MEKETLQEKIERWYSIIFKFRRKQIGWFTFYLFESNGRRWEFGFVLDESEGQGPPMLVISFLIGSVEMCRPYRDKDQEINDAEDGLTDEERFHHYGL